jgi:hypothetical protein
VAEPLEPLLPEVPLVVPLPAPLVGVGVVGVGVVAVGVVGAGVVVAGTVVAGAEVAGLTGAYDVPGAG